MPVRSIDTIHLALAVYHGMDFLLSWNFLHIVGAKPRAIIEQINDSVDLIRF